MILMKKGWRPSRILVALVMVFAASMPILTVDQAHAAVLTDREIRLSSSAASATSVTYHVQFNFGTSTDVQGIVVDFCSDSPIIGDTDCTATIGTNVPDLGSSPTVSGQTNTAGGDISTFTTAGQLNSNRTLTLTAASPVSMTSGTTASFDITGVINPSTLGTFYARVYTYATAGGATGYTLSGGSYIDAGGIALSTAEQITVTAKVAERLVFCVYTTGTGNNCDTKGGGDVTLGNDKGILDPTGPFVDKNAKYSITTNAASGAIVRMKGDTLTKPPSDTITAIGDTAASSSFGSEQFGLCNYESAGTGMTFTYTTYDGGGNCSTTTQSAGTATTGGVGTATFGFDDNSSDGTTSTYGDPIATKPSGDWSTATLAFIGNVSNSTEAGIYTATLTFIATGVY